jgi:hydroxyacylglutathione hydrolase
MSALEISQYAYLSDNYGVLLHSAATGETAAIDAGDGAALLAVLKEKGWKLTDLFITHHHADHTGGLAEVKAATACRVTGPRQHSRIVGLDRLVEDGDTLQFAGCEVQVIHTPGHTTDMLNYYLPTEGIVFTGDTLFALGCGRLFEGNAEMMWQSLGKLMALPRETVVYCSHEYTLANAEFAVTVDPDNQALRQRMATIQSLRAEGKPTVPSTLAEELATNPFLRANDPAIRQHLKMADADDAEVFAEIRARKDNF